MSSITQFIYRFTFPDGRKRVHNVELEGETGKLQTKDTPPPDWAKLDFHKCNHCPLNSATDPYCPVAKNLAVSVEEFKSERSYDLVEVEVETAERTYSKKLPLQQGLYGLFGLIMATSACPYFEFLRLMARFHLPFSTLQETVARSVSFYLLRQHFVAKRGGKPDFELQEYAKLYKDVEKVNLGLVQRIRSVAVEDANANSVVSLDALAKMLSTQLGKGLESLEKTFSARP